MTRRALQPVPETPPRALGLIRVSKDRDGTISPDVQRASIADYAAARGYQIVGWLEGIDESGSRLTSRWWAKLDQAVAMVEDGDVDGIIVWRFSRTARHRLKWATALHRVDNSKGFLEAAQEQFDTKTAIGRLARGMTGEFNAFQAELIGEGWKEAHARRVASGRPANGKPRWGYVYDPVEKLHKPDPETGPVLAEVYRRYVAGESIYGLVRWLNGHGWRTTTGGAWSEPRLRTVLGSGFAAGKFTANGVLLDGVHEPLIDAATWQAYLDARHARAARPARSVRSQYVLSGLVRCARCGGAMVAGQFGAARAPKYRCATSKQAGPEACRGGYVMARFLEAEVIAELGRVAGRVEEHADATAAVSARRAAVRSDARRLAREVARVEQALARLAVQNARDPLPPGVYRQAREELDEQLVQLQGALEDAGREERASGGVPARLAAGLLEAWEEWPVEQRREALRRLVGCVLVTTGRPRARVRVVMAWEIRSAVGGVFG